MRAIDQPIMHDDSSEFSGPGAPPRTGRPPPTARDNAAAPASGALAAMSAAFSAAAAVTGEVGIQVRIAGSRIHLAIAGALLAERIMLTLRHLVVTNGEPCDLRLQLWDSAASGTPRPIADLRR